MNTEKILSEAFERQFLEEVVLRDLGIRRLQEARNEGITVEYLSSFFDMQSIKQFVEEDVQLYTEAEQRGQERIHRRRLESLTERFATFFAEEYLDNYLQPRFAAETAKRRLMESCDVYPCYESRGRL